MLTVACVRLGDHAHVEVESGYQIPDPRGTLPRLRRSNAGHLIFPWHEWLQVRALLDTVPWTRIAEIERPTLGQAARYT